VIKKKVLQSLRSVTTRTVKMKIRKRALRPKRRRNSNAKKPNLLMMKKISQDKLSKMKDGMTPRKKGNLLEKRSHLRENPRTTKKVKRIRNL